MKPTIDNLKGTFQLSYDTYLESRLQAEMIQDMFEGDQYCSDILQELEEAGRPAEIFNVIRMFTRQLMGYYSTVYNTVRVNPVQYNDINTAALLNDIIKNVDRVSHTTAINEQLRLDCILSGLMVHFIEAIPKKATDGEIITDEFGRTIYEVKKIPVHSREILLDPMSTEIDYSDGRFIHRYRWLTKEAAIDMFSKYKIDKLDANNEAIASAFFDPMIEWQNQYKDYDNYLIVHTIMREKDKTWSIYWSGDEILSKKEISYREVKNPYQVVKLQDTYKPKYYGIFKDVYQAQNAINQAILQIQLMVNSNKVIVRKGAIADEDWEGFKKAIIRVNAVLELDNPEDVSILNMSGDIAQQYLIIDKAFDRIQRVLGINDSFLGIAYASDSGRKVKLQQNATMMALRYMDVKFDLMFKLIGMDTVNLVKQFYTANQVLRITDESTGDRWVEINKPLIDPETNAPVLYPETDPATGDMAQDEFGNYIVTPLKDPDTDIEFTEVDIDLVSVAYNDDDEKNQLMLETMLNGPIGNMLAQANPAGYLKAGALVVRGMKSKYSDDIQNILAQTSEMLSPQQQQQLGQGGQFPSQPKSQGLKLPQNTNEGM